MNIKLSKLLDKKDIAEYKRLYSLSPHLVELFLKYLSKEKEATVNSLVTAASGINQQLEIAELVGKMKAISDFESILKSVIEIK